MGFNPDEYLKDQPTGEAPKTSSASFNPDEFLAGSQPEGPGVLSKLKNAYAAVSPATQYEKQNPGSHVIGGTPLDNPLIGLSAPGPVAAEGLAAAAKPILGPVAKYIGERFATSPLPGKMASLGKLPEGASMFGKVVTEPARIVGDIGKLAKGAQSTVTKIMDNPATAATYGKALKTAASRGGNALATTDFLLQQRDPEYQKLRKDLSE